MNPVLRFAWRRPRRGAVGSRRHRRRCRRHCEAWPARRDGRQGELGGRDDQRGRTQRRHARRSRSGISRKLPEPSRDRRPLRGRFGLTMPDVRGSGQQRERCQRHRLAAHRQGTSRREGEEAGSSRKQTCHEWLRTKYSRRKTPVLCVKRTAPVHSDRRRPRFSLRCGEYVEDWRVAWQGERRGAGIRSRFVTGPHSGLKAAALFSCGEAVSSRRLRMAPVPSWSPVQAGLLFRTFRP